MAVNLCERLKIGHPVVLGGLAGIGDAVLAAAVTNAGALGVLGAGAWKGLGLADQIERARQLTQGPLGVNIPIHAKHAEELVEVLIEKKIEAAITSAGNPARFAGRLKEAGIFLAHVVPSVGHARLAEAAGVDAVVAEGCESGGFTSRDMVSTMVLVPQVADAVRLPVIAAGGIADGRGMAAALALGASAVQVGTAFMVAQECSISPAYKEMIIRAQSSDTYLKDYGKAFLRLFRDELYTEARIALRTRDPESQPELGIDKGAMLRGGGQVAGLIGRVRPAAEIVSSMVEQARQVAQNLEIKCE